jgi:hypothetical protein
MQRLCDPDPSNDEGGGGVMEMGGITSPATATATDTSSWLSPPRGSGGGYHGAAYEDYVPPPVTTNTFQIGTRK